MNAPHPDQIVVSLSEPSWGFDNKGPAYHVSHAGIHPLRVEVDPAPAYTHDQALVEQELAALQRIAPISAPLAIVLLSHEFIGRTNGQCTNTSAWIRETNEQKPVSLIVLCGKRIPIHPAMTRYLVAHEYGHAVEEELRRRRGVKDFQIRTDYQQRVRPDTSGAYGCGRWHASIGELFANDFRILVAEREIEFWPHPGFERPEANLAAVGFWTQAIAELKGTQS